MRNHLTKAQRRMRDYVVISPHQFPKWDRLRSGPADQEHNVFLQVKNQRFHLYTSDTLSEAEWMRDMFCVALAKIIAEQDGKK